MTVRGRQARLERLTDGLAVSVGWEGRNEKDAIRRAILGDDMALRRIPGGENLADSLAMAIARLSYAAGKLAENIHATLPKWRRSPKEGDE